MEQPWTHKGAQRRESPPVVYVVDPDRASREDVQRLLLGPGHAVRCFPSAEAFLAAFEPESAACLVTELNLPGLDGIELVTRVVRSDPRVPSIILTADASVREAVTAIRAGAASVVSKPIRRRALIEEVRRFLRPQHLE